MRLFGKAKTAPSVQDSIGKLKETLDLLEKREEYLNARIGKEVKFARDNAQKNRKGAIMALKRKRAYESQITKCQGARWTIEQQMMAIENAHVSQEAMAAMRSGAATMRSINRNMTVDQVDDTMDEIRDQMEVAEEIETAIAQPLGEVFDDDELEAELAELEEETIDEHFLAAPTTAKPPYEQASLSPDKLPSVPSEEIPLSDEERALHELEASMAF